MTESTVNYSIEYDVRGVDRSIHSTQRMLYAVNALRLSIVDLQRLSSDKSLGNLLWTGIQLTRTWTLLYNLVKQTNAAQASGGTSGAMMSLLGGTLSGAGGAAYGSGAAMRSLFGEAIESSLAFTPGGSLGVPMGGGGLGGGFKGMSLAMSTSSWIGLGVGLAVIAGITIYDYNSRKQLQELKRRNRDTAKTQGLEN